MDLTHSNKYFGQQLKFSAIYATVDHSFYQKTVWDWDISKDHQQAIPFEVFIVHYKSCFYWEAAIYDLVFSENLLRLFFSLLAFVPHSPWFHTCQYDPWYSSARYLPHFKLMIHFSSIYDQLNRWLSSNSILLLANLSSLLSFFSALLLFTLAQSVCTIFQLELSNLKTKCRLFLLSVYCRS